MMKRILILSLAFLLGMSVTSEAAMMLEYDGEAHEYKGSIYKLLVNGEEIETPLEPIIFNDRALVPVREVFEAAGATVDYQLGTKGIYVSGNGITMRMNIGSKSVIVNGELETFPDGVTPKLIAKRGQSAKTMVPVRFISETLKYEVLFDGDSISIITNNKPTEEPEDKNDEDKNADDEKNDEKNDEKDNEKDNEEEIIPKLSSVYCNRSGDAAMISVKADGEIEKISEPILTQAGVLYVDIYGVENTLPRSKDIKRGAVLSIRTGMHDGFIRVALDTENLKSYSVELSKDKKAVKILTVKKSEDKKEKEKIVVIDAGHGGADGGAAIEYDGELIKEKDINLSVAKKTVAILETNNVTVEMTRTGDTFPELAERAAFANELDAAIFVSIHSNSATSASANGIEVYYATGNNGTDYGIKSQELAQKILDAMILHTDANNRKVKSEAHVVTRTSNMPAALVELGFITNEDELKKMIDDDYQDKLASGIAEGILKCIPKVSVPDGSIDIDDDDLGDKII